MEPLLLKLHQKYVDIIKTIGMGILYMPALPISPVIAVVGFLVALSLCIVPHCNLFFGLRYLLCYTIVLCCSIVICFTPQYRV